MSDASLIALSQAIKFESDGRDFYLGLAEKLADPLARALFRSLAEDERQHIARVREIHEELKAKPGWPSVAAMIARSSGALDAFEKEAFGKTPLSADADLRAALAKAIELERESVRFYAARGAEASCDGEHEFFARLEAEEKRHLSYLEKTLKTL